MSGTRYAELTLVVGERGGGKTNETLRILYIAANSRKVLIFDSQGEFAHYIFRKDQPPHKIKAIKFSDIPRFTAQTFPEMRRTTPHLDTGEVMTVEQLQDQLFYILKNFRNGILLVEDINVYISDNAPNDLMGALATLRQKGVDVIVHYQLIGKAAHPKMLGFANYIRLHKTGVSVERHRKQFGDTYTDLIVLAEYIVARRYKYGVDNGVYNDTGKFFSCLINLKERKITGIFTEAEAKKAIEDYISANPNKTVQVELKKLNKDGKKVWPDWKSAYHYVESNLLDTYFNFKKENDNP